MHESGRDGSLQVRMKMEMNNVHVTAACIILSHRKSAVSYCLKKMNSTVEITCPAV